MSRHILTCVVFLVCALGSPTDRAHAQTPVSGEWITLGDVAPVTGEAADILLGPAPPPGQTLAMDPAFIISTARSAGVVVAIPLDAPVLVKRLAGGAPSAAAARSAPAARSAQPARTLTPTPAGQMPGQVPGQVLVLVRDVARGDVISADDLDWADAAAARLRGIDQLDAVAGMEARRSLRAGQPVLATDIRAPAVIRKGDPVKLVYATGGVRISVDGVAQNEAAMGEGVRILNTYSRRTVDAVAAGAGEAHIHSTGRSR